MTPEEIRVIVHHATKKGEGCVGRTGRIEMTEKAYLATQAHIRHTKTIYEDLMRSGTNRKAARVLTATHVSDVIDEWGPVPIRRKVKTARKQMPLNSTLKTRDSANTSLKPTAKTMEQSARAGQANRIMAIPGGLLWTKRATIVSPGNTAEQA